MISSAHSAHHHLKSIVLNTNNLVRADKRIKPLTLAPSILHAAVGRESVALMTSVDKFQPAFVATVDGAESIHFLLLVGAAGVTAFWNVVAASGPLFRVPIGGCEAVSCDLHGADGPDFELVVPDCGACALSARNTDPPTRAALQTTRPFMVNPRTTQSAIQWRE